MDTERIKEQKRKASKRWRKKNPEYQRQWRAKNKEHVRELTRISRLRCKERYHEKRMFHVKQRQRMKRCASGSHTLEQWLDLKKEFNYCCADCGMQEPFTDQYYQWLTEDHIIPISKGGSNDIENIQPYCARCNSSKCDKI